MAAIFPLPPVSSIRIQDGRCGCIDCRNREGGTWYTDLKTREKWKGSLNPSAAATDFTVAQLSNRFLACLRMEHASRILFPELI